MSRRPEHENPPEVYYNDTVARRYDQSSRIRNIQRKMSERALELLQLPQDEPCHILDVGCGSGLSGEVLESHGHSWVGMDISLGMLKLAKASEFESSDDENDADVIRGNGNRRPSPFGQLPLAGEVEEEEEDEDEDEPSAPARKFREVIAADMGLGAPFRPGVFDGVVSISAIQWLCYMDKKSNIPQKRLKTLFQSLYNCLRRGARAVLQFYPESATQMNMISQAAMKCGFGGGMVVDYPHSTKAKKYFLVLYAGQPGGNYSPPQPLLGDPVDYDDVDADELTEEDEDDEEDEEVEDEDDAMGEGGKRIRTCARSRPQGGQKAKRRRKDNRPATGSREWVLLKKDERRRFGLKTSEDSKYTMRRRKPRF
jgi:18S rRNA (guanine1575-N7)-methyltransferase